MSFKGFKQKDLKANEYVIFLKNLDKVRLDVENQINQSADIMNTKAKVRQEMNAPIIKALNKTEADFAEIDKKLSAEQIAIKISNVIKGSNAEIIDFFTNANSMDIEDDNTGMQLVFDDADDTLITLGKYYSGGPYSRIAFNPTYTQLTPYDISDEAIPVSRGLLLLLLLKLNDLKAYGALPGQSADDLDTYLKLVQDANQPDDVTFDEKFIELNDLFTQKSQRNQKFKEKTARNMISDFYDKSDATNAELENFFLTSVANTFTEVDVEDTVNFLLTPVDSLDSLVKDILDNPKLLDLNKKYGLFELFIGYPDNKFSFDGFYFKKGDADPSMPNDGNLYRILSTRSDDVEFPKSTKSPSLKSGEGYIFSKDDFTDVFYRKKMGNKLYQDQFDYMKKPDGSDVDPNNITLTLLQVLIGIEGIEFLIRYASHFYNDTVLKLEKEIRDNPGDAGNALREGTINDIVDQFNYINAILTVNKGRRDIKVVNPKLEKDVYDKFVDISQRLRQSTGGSITKPKAKGGRLMSPEKFKEIKEMKKIEASNPINLTGGMISMKPAGKPKGRKPANGLYMLKNNQFGGLTIDMPQLFNNMKIKAMKGGSIAYEGIADKDTIDLLTKRYDSRRTYSGLAQKNIAKLIQMSELPPSENSAKLKMTQRYITSKRARKGLKGGKIPEMDELIAMIGSLNAGNTPNKKLNNQIFDLAAKLVKSGDLDMETYKQILNNYT